MSTTALVEGDGLGLEDIQPPNASFPFFPLYHSVVDWNVYEACCGSWDDHDDGCCGECGCGPIAGTLILCGPVHFFGGWCGLVDLLSAPIRYCCYRCRS